MPIGSGGSAGSGIGSILFESNLAAPALTLDTGAGGIAGSVRLIHFYLYGRTDEAAATSVINLTFNNDTGNNYSYQLLTSADTTLTGARTTGVAQAFMVTLPAANGTAGRPGINRLTIPGYARTVFHKVGEFTGGYNYGNHSLAHPDPSICALVPPRVRNRIW